jgi:hypothetical protein
MLRARRRLAAIGTSLALAAAPGVLSAASPATPARGRPAAPRYLIYLIDGGDPIVVDKYAEEDGQIRFEKYGGWVSIPRYEVLRIVPDTTPPDPPDAVSALPAVAAADGTAPLYVTTRAGAIRATQVGTAGAEVRIRTSQGSLSLPRTDMVGVLRVPAPPGQPEAWITLWGAADGGPVGGEAVAAAPSPAPQALPELSNQPHLLQLASGVVVQVDGFWIEGGELRFRRLGGIVGFALSEIVKLLPQEAEPSQGRLAARFVRRVGPDRLEVRVGQDLQRIHLIGIDPVADDGVGDDPWATLQRGLLVHLEFDRKRYEPDGHWLAYLYLPNGRMLNAELIRVGLARPRTDGQNLRYVDLFEDVGRKNTPPSPTP